MRVVLSRALVISALLAASACKETTSIGERWYLELTPSPIIEAGTQKPLLVRKTSHGRVVVGEMVEQHRFYAPDCVIFQSAMHAHQVFAVCGDRTPVAIAVSGENEWKLDDDGLRRTDEAVIDSVGGVVKPLELIPIAQVIALAIAQPPYREGWASGVALDPSNPPVPSVITYARASAIQGPNGSGALLEAVARERADMVEALLTHGSDVNATDNSGATPLMIASGRGLDSIITRLIAAGAKLDLQDRTGRVALMYAASVGHTGAVKLLLAAGANAKLRDEQGRTTRERIERFSRDEELLRRLREAEAR